MAKRRKAKRSMISWVRSKFRRKRSSSRRVAKRSNIDRLHSEFRRKGGGSRQTTLRVLGGKLDKNGSPFHKEHFQFEDERDGPRTVDVVQMGTCSFGHTIGDKVRLAGICERGDEVLCSVEGCMLRCVHCGAVVCRVHSSTSGDKTYCQRHKWVLYWRMFWRLD